MTDQKDKDAILGILDHIADQLDVFLADAQEERLEIRRRQWKIAHD